MISSLLKKFRTDSPLQLEAECRPEGLLARVKRGERIVPPEEWFREEGPWRAKSRERALHWRRLAEEGTESTPDGILWPHERMGGLMSAQIGELFESQRFPYLPTLSATEHLRHPQLAYELEFLDAAGRTVPLRLYPALAQLGERFWVLPQAIRELYQGLCRARPDAERGAERYAELGRFKGLLAQAGGSCDDYLQKQQVLGVDQIQFDLEDDGQELRLTPYAPHLPDGMDLEKMAVQFSRVQDEYTSMGSQGQVIRVLPSANVREALTKWRQIRRLRGSQRMAFLQKPRAFLTTSAIDWDDLDSQLQLLQQSQSPAPAEPQDPLERPRAPLLPTQNWDDSFEDAEWVEPSQELPQDSTPLPVPSARQFPVAQIPPSLSAKVQLLAHQREGIAWLQSLVEEGRAGGLLADDMGLGKTLQVLTFLEWMRLREGRSSLVVAPLILLQNWKREYLQFFAGPSALVPEEIVVLYGEELRGYRKGRGLDVDRLAQKPLIITSLEMLRMYQVDLEKVDWSTVVVDEAQAIKNPGALVSRAANSLRATFRLAATGTPVENSLGDLWSLLQFAQPGCLGARRDFLQQNRCDTLEEMEQVSQQLQERIEPFYLRRTKKDLLKELPAKHHHFVPLAMPGSQAAAYARTLDEIRREGKAGLEASWTLRKASCWDGECGQSVSEMVARSCKFSWLLAQLSQIRAKQEKALVFVDIVELQELLLMTLEHELKIRVEVINGQTSSGPSQSGREAILQRFRSQPGFGVIILSPKAAGVGLTLLEANHVIHFSRMWNPAREDQATDRVYRIGQTKEVHVYYPLAEHSELQSFDTYLNEVLERKRKLAESALFPALMGDVQSEDMEAFFSGAQTTVQEVPAWVRLLRSSHDFTSLEDLLAALEPTGISLYRLLPRIGRLRHFNLPALARACDRQPEELFPNPLPAEAEAATVLDSTGQWVLFLSRGLASQRELAYCGHSVLHRALGHLARKDQRGHWDRWSDLTTPSRRWDREVSQWLPLSEGSLAP